MSAIPPNSPPPSSPAPITPFSGTGATTPKVPVDFFEVSLASTLGAPSISASAPRISLAEFYEAVSSADLAQKLREYLDAMNDPLFRKQLMQFALEQSSYLADVIILVYRYDSLQNQLNNLHLSDKANSINTKYNQYINSGGGISADNAAIDDLNAAINDYNSAQSIYNSALSTYQAAVSAYQTAQNTYNTALQNWNNALSAYQGGSITAAQLESARASFDAAKNQFENVDKPAFNSSQSIYDSAKANWLSKVNDFNQEVSLYNAHAVSRSNDLDDLNQAIDDWNTSAGNASSIISQMNDVLSALGLAPITSTVSLTQISGISTFTIPTIPHTLRDGVQNGINQGNTLSGSMNGTIGIINGKITLINASGYTPALITPASQGTIANIPISGIDNPIGHIALISAPAPIHITLPPQEDLITNYLAPRLSIIIALKESNDQENRYRESMTDEKFKIQLSARGTDSSVLGASNLNLASTANNTSSPFLISVLSKHAFQTFFNTHGVPAGSPLIDQIGALYTQLETFAGLTGAGPASEILGEIAAPGKGPIDTAVALGNLKVTFEVATSDELKLAIGALISQDPALQNLTPAQKNAFLEQVAGEIGASLNKAALNELARVLGLPGLVPQILALVAGVTEKDPLAPFSSQLFKNVLFARELAKNLNISEEEASDIIQKAIERQANNAPKVNTTAPSSASTSVNAADQATQIQAANDAALEQAVINEVEQRDIVQTDIEKKVVQSSFLANQLLQAELGKINAIKTATFKDSLIKSFAELEMDPVRGDLIAAQIPLHSLDDIKAALKAKGLTEPDVSEIAIKALNAANLKDPLVNPLSSFLAQTLGTTTELSALLKAQVTNILSPAVGERNALAVAEDYGSLIFSSANSVTGLLQVNERRLDAISQFIYHERLYEDYRNATISYTSPELALDSPLKLGKTLLLTGIPGGLSNQGLTSADNILGPSANQSKHSTSYPGIFG